MIVPDASAVVEMLEAGPFAGQIIDAMETEGAIAPHLLDLEVLTAIRGLVSARRMEATHAQRLVDELLRFPITRIAHGSLLARIWELRHNFTPYDAAYVAVAEQMNAVLYTLDAKLVNGHRARVVLFRP